MAIVALQTPGSRAGVERGRGGREVHGTVDFLSSGGISRRVHRLLKRAPACPAMTALVECVPNFSEGRNAAVIKEITDTIEAVPGIKLLDVDMGADTNRTVVTFVGDPDAVAEAAVAGVRRAAEVIDMRQHKGAHPRMGATDVCPFVPVDNITMEECADIARAVGRRIGDELSIPVYLYEEAASRPAWANLSTVRSGEYEGLAERFNDPAWAPDFGPAEFNARAGATAVGAREFLIAYNLNLNTTERKYANEIAYELRERGRWKRVGNTEPFYYKGKVVYFEDDKFPDGNSDFVGATFDELAEHYRATTGGDLRARYKYIGLDVDNLTGKPVYKDGRFTHVKGIGWVIDEYHRSQVSMNLTNYKITPTHAVLEAAREEAVKRGIVITGTEIVGLLPWDALRESARYYLRRMHKSTGLPVPDLVENAVQSLGLRDVSDFDPAEKVLALPTVNGPLVQRTTWDFIDEVSRDTPAPGGGSVAALAGALGAALSSMVANLSVTMPKFHDRYDELCGLAERAQELKDALVRGVDDDTSAFDKVIEGMRMAKDTDAERAERARVMQAGYRQATRVPLTTVEQCHATLQLCNEMVAIADAEMISDVGTAALMAHAGAQAAAYNVRINLRHIKDKAFNSEMRERVGGLLDESSALATQITQRVDETLLG